MKTVYSSGLNFIWPNKGAIPGARITAIDLEGKTHTIVDEPGEYGINRLIEGATAYTIWQLLLKCCGVVNKIQKRL